MGGTYWHHDAPWHPDANVALKALQSRFVTENYDLAMLLPRELASARENVANLERYGDEYRLMDIYRDRVALLENLCGQPIPESAEARIVILRTIEAATGSEIGNVLDIIAVSERQDYPTSQPLDANEVDRLVGVPRPTLADAQKAVRKIEHELDRGESVCFPIFDGGKPAGWFFVGSTVD